METLQYTTNDGERWDSIAYKAYGNPGLAKIIIEANPNVVIQDRLPAGTLLEIPVLPSEQVLTDIELLPPWKR